MRFAFVFSMPAAFAALAGCNSPPALPDTAWMVTMTQASAVPTMPCAVFDSMVSVGSLSQDTILSRVTTGTMGAVVKCSVAPKGAGVYIIDATGTLGDDTLHINIPAISASATEAAPAIGSVEYESNKSVTDYTSNACNFYFISGTQETVVPGRIWVAFQCPVISNGPSMSSCTVLQSFAVFEDCETVAGN